MAVIVGPTLAKLLEGLPTAYGLKQRSEADMPFLRLLYAQTREDELAPVPWTAQQRRRSLPTSSTSSTATTCNTTRRHSGGF